MRQAGFAYAQTRMQARFATRPTASEWQMIETGRRFVQTLDAVARTSMAPLAAPLSRDSTWAEVEQALRTGWAERVAEVANWLPPAWQAACLWLIPLPHLRLIERATVPPDLHGTNEIVAGIAEGRADSDIWRAGFANRVPGPDTMVQAALAPLLDRYLIGPPKPTAAEGLEDHLTDVFRRHAQTPAAAFAWLGLVALDIERLRGALLVSTLFPTAEEVR